MATPRRKTTTREFGDGRSEYRVVELVTVTDAEIERALNETERLGWRFESMHFAMWEGSRRPSMAFLMFSRTRKARRS